MTVSIVSNLVKVSMYLEKGYGESLTSIGENAGVSRQTVRRCIQEVSDYISEIRRKEVTVVYSDSGDAHTIVGLDSPIIDSVPIFAEDCEGTQSYFSLSEALDNKETEVEVVEQPRSLVVGDTVVIRKGSRFYGNLLQNNPKNVEGIVTSICEGRPLPISVSWSHTSRNSYSREDLELVKGQVDLEEEDAAEYYVVAPQDSITIIRMLDGEVESRNINKHTQGFADIRTMIVASQDKATLAEAYCSMDIKDVIATYSVGRVKIDVATESVSFVRTDGSTRKIPEDIAIDIIGTIQEYGRESGDRLAKFLDKLMDNTSFKAIEGLYRFMKHNCISINEDGSIEAWKGVRDDFYSQHGGSIQSSDTITVNGAGNVYNGDFGVEIRVDRSEVDDDPDQTCSHGLHVGNRAYASGWASTLICVKVQPQDVVAVPKDYNGAKMRTCAYTPIRVAAKN